MLSYIEPIKNDVSQKSLTRTFMMHNNQSLVMIGLINEYFTILTNQKLG